MPITLRAEAIVMFAADGGGVGLARKTDSFEAAFLGRYQRSRPSPGLRFR